MDALMNYRKSEYIAQQIAVEILSGRFGAEMPLRQEEIAEQLQVSRIPVREALQILESQGMAQRLTTRHMVVTPLENDDIFDIYNMIGDMECKLLANLERRGQHQRLHQIIVEDQVSFEEIHLYIAQNARDGYLKKMFQDALIYYVDFATKCSSAAGDELTYVMKQGKEAEIQEHIREHYMDLAKRVIEERRKNR